MVDYIIRRILLMVPTLFLVTIIVFGLVRFIPGDVVEIMLNEQGAMQMSGEVTEVTVDMIREKLGLHLPIHVQYGQWISNIILHGDFGKSLWTDMKLTDELVTRLPVTFQLGLMAILISQLVGIPLGLYSAIRQDTVGDYLGRGIAIAFIAVPAFWMGTLIQVYPSIWWGWTPPVELVEFVDNPAENLKMFAIPAAILGLEISGITMRITRTMALEVLRQDYVRTAWAKGVKERVVIRRHVLRNSLIPVVTVIGLYLPVMVGGTVVIEQIFCLPGVGRLLLQAIMDRDYALVSGINLIVACFVLVAVLLTDLTYSFLDPRVRYK